jgi:mRNA-degrading endonuclease RelE of RelBE toxin-antitoxin system
VSASGWDLVVAGPARRSIDRIPAKVAVAVLDFLVGPLIENPHRVGKPLRGELSGLHSARVGTYRVVYEIIEEQHTVRVLYIDHRADVYRPR